MLTDLYNVLSYCHIVIIVSNLYILLGIVSNFVRDWFADGCSDLNYSTEASNENPMTIDSDQAWKLQHLRAEPESAPSLARRSQAQPGSESAPGARRGRRNSVRVSGQSRCWPCQCDPGPPADRDSVDHFPRHRRRRRPGRRQLERLGP